MTVPGEFDLQHTASGRRHTFQLFGELDVDSAPLLQAALSRLQGADIRSITLDLSEVSFISSSGLRVVLAIRESCLANGCELSLVPGPSAVQRLFQLTNLTDVLPFTGPASGTR